MFVLRGPKQNLVYLVRLAGCAPNAPSQRDSAQQRGVDRSRPSWPSLAVRIPGLVTGERPTPQIAAWPMRPSEA
eukprot:4070987-Alexandrium_andersonii.AAC.1